MKQLLINIARLFSKISDWVQKLSIVLGSGILISMFVIAGLGVVFRFMIKSSLSWNEELDGYLFVWLTSIGAAMGYKYRAHPAVEILVDRLPTVLRRFFRVIADLIVLTLGVIFIISGQKMVVLLGMETASSLDMSMSYPYLSIPVGGALLAIHAVASILETLFLTSDSSAGEDVHDGKGEFTWEH